MVLSPPYRFRAYWRGDTTHYYVPATFVCERLGIRDRIDFAVDTGSHTTFISQTDALRLGMDYRKLATARAELKTIYGPLSRYLLYDYQLIFDSENMGRFIMDASKGGPYFDFPMSIIDAANERTTPAYLPSILGARFLREFDAVLRLHKDSPIMTIDLFSKDVAHL